MDLHLPNLRSNLFRGRLRPGAAAAARRQPLRRDYVPAIGGGFCYYEAYVGATLNKPYENWILMCPRHDNCQKKRGIGPYSTKFYGELLGGSWSHWRSCMHGGIWKCHRARVKTHRQCTPSPVAVDAQMDRNMLEVRGVERQVSSSVAHTGGKGRFSESRTVWKMLSCAPASS